MAAWTRRHDAASPRRHLLIRRHLKTGELAKDPRRLPAAEISRRYIWIRTSGCFGS